MHAPCHDTISPYPLKIFSGSSHPELAKKIAQYLDVPVGLNRSTRLPDGEIHVIIEEVVRGHDIFFVQTGYEPVNRHLMETFLYLDAFHRASAHSVTVILPYYPYARQERMSKGREAISAKVVAHLLESMHMDRLICVDIHTRAIQGFFNVPVDLLSAIPLMAQYFMRPEFDNCAIVAPDLGIAKLAGKFAKMVGKPLVIIEKNRLNFEETEVVNIIGDIKGHQPILIDDVIAGGSILKQIDALYDKGAVGKTYFAITHPVLLPRAVSILDADERIEKLITTDSIPLTPERLSSKIEVLSIAPLLGDVIQDIYMGKSISPRMLWA